MNGQDISERGRWGSKIAFIFAATGSAIGLGNIWRFPMVVGKYGGAVFVLVYILAVALVGFTVMLAELVIGRHTQQNAVGAFEAIKPKTPWKGIGFLAMLTSICIFSYYSVISGWAAGYFVKTVSGVFKGAVTSQLSEKIYSDFTSDPVQVMVCFLIVIAISAFIISRGVKDGIERWTKVLMPILFILIIFLAVKALTLPGAKEGVSFYLKPDFSKLNGTVVLFAFGQAFFSLSLGMGIMITYGSYIPKSVNLVSSAAWVSFSDSFIAFLAGIIIFPTLFAIPGIEPTAGPGLVFKVFPLIFSKIPGGNIFGVLFFLLLLVAAITSTISLLEVSVSYFIDKLKWPRKKAAFLLGSFGFCLGIPIALSSGGIKFFTDIDFMGKFDVIFANIMLAVGALLICLFVGWIWGIKVPVKEIHSGNTHFTIRPLWIFSLKFLSPIVLIIILIFIKKIISG
ncbi:sodium-dependent transporter [Acidobacteriota bacterium]